MAAEVILEYKTYPKNMNNPLHTICSYMAMFPPSLPNYFIKKYSKQGDIVFDPFCGRGTAPLEACFENRIGVGSDKNPLAFILTKAKVNVPQKGRIIARIKNLEREFTLESLNLTNENVPWQIKMIYHNQTLRQLLFLRRKLNWHKSNVDAFVMALILGIMHGGSLGYLSLSMPNTFSMSPNYVKRYIKEHNLKKPQRNVFELLIKKLERCYQKQDVKGLAFSLDARKLTKIKDNSIDLIITSPPYTRLITYGKFNWIRLWLLNKAANDIEKKLFTTQSLPRYLNFMTQVLSELKRVLKSKSKAVIVIGDVQDRDHKTLKLAELVWENCAKPLGFQLIEEIHEDIVNDGCKVSKIWGQKRLSISSKIERVLVLEK